MTAGARDGDALDAGRTERHFTLGLDVRSVQERRQGIGNYTLELVRALADVPDAPSLVLFGRADTAWRLLPDAPRLEGPGGPRWHFWAAAHARQLDLFHSPGSLFVPVLARTPTVLTVHDLVPFRLPEEADPWSTFTHLAFRAAVRRAAAIAADSRFTADDLADFAPEAAAKTIAVPLASRFAPDKAISATCDRLSGRQDAGASGSPGSPGATEATEATDAELPDSGYILAVGSLEPRKNLAALLAAHAALPDPAPPLVLVGNRAWKHQTLETRIAAHPRQIRVIRDASDESLAALYARCGVFVFPSRYEGFGLPVVEAMACGAPVVTSTAASIPEAAGGAALAVDPDDVSGLAEAILRVLQEPSLRADLITRGRARALSRTWADVARETLGVYRRALPLVESAKNA